MANQTVSITPADVTDPTLLYRALSRITELLDELKGYRGTEVDNQKAELDQLVQAAIDLRTKLEGLLVELENKINKEAGKSLADLADELAALTSVVDNLKTQVTSLRTDVDAINLTKPVCGFTLKLTGAGSSNPSLSNAFNISTAVRLGVGSYRITLTDSTKAGKSVLANAMLNEKSNISGNTFVKTRFTVVNSTTLDLAVFSLSNTFTAIAYDLTSADTIDLFALLAP